MGSGNQQKQHSEELRMLPQHGIQRDQPGGRSQNALAAGRKADRSEAS